MTMMGGIVESETCMNDAVWESFLNYVTRIGTEKPVDIFGTDVLAQTALQLTIAEQLAEIAKQLAKSNEREDMKFRRGFHIKNEG